MIKQLDDLWLRQPKVYVISYLIIWVAFTAISFCVGILFRRSL